MRFCQRIIAVGLLASLVGCGKPPDGAAAAPALTVTVATVAIGSVERWASLVGTLEARDEAVASVEGAGGRILALPVEVGAVVSAGQEVAVLDDANARLRQAQQVAEVARAQATRAQAAAQVAETEVTATEAKQSVERLEGLAASQSIAAETLGAKRAMQAAAQARVTAAIAGLAGADAELTRLATVGQEVALALTRTRITAPAAGIVSARPARVGQVVNPGEVLMTIAVDGVIEFAAEVPEELLPQISLGAPVELAAEGGIRRGSVRRIDPAVDRMSRLGSLRVTLSSSSKATERVGSSAHGRLRLGLANGLCVPLSSLIREGVRDGKKTLAVVVGPDGIAQRVEVTTGLDDGVRVIILSGLQAGQRVIANAPGFVTDGTRVATVE